MVSEMIPELWTQVSCGCRFRRELRGQERVFVIKPCRDTCETYIFAQQETSRQGKPMRFVHEGGARHG